MHTAGNQDHTLQDQALLVRIREDDEPAFKRLFMKYYSMLKAYAYTVVRNSFEAEEVVSDVFFKLWQGRGNLDASMNVRAYLFTAVRNQSLNYLRTNNVKQLTIEEVVEQKSPNVEDDIFYREYVQRIQTVIDAMPARQQEVFRLSRIHGLTYNEIAATLSISPHTVQEYMVNALKHLRNYIKDQRLLE